MIRSMFGRSTKFELSSIQALPFWIADLVRRLTWAYSVLTVNMGFRQPSENMYSFT